jgi:hypothetical protein
MSEIDNTVKKNIRKVVKPEVDQTIEIKESNELLDLIKSMRAEIDALKANKEAPQPQYAYPSGSNNRYVEVVSLYDGSLFLSTQERGEGKRYQFKSFGNTQKIAANDLEDVIRVSHSFATDGHFYIKDKKFVEDSGLQESYTGLLTKEQLIGIVDGKFGVDFDTLFKNATDYQKSLVYQLAVKKVATGIYEANVINKIERLANSYIKALNKNKVPQGEKFPEGLLVDIVDKGKSDSHYDARGNIKQKSDDYEE